MKSPQEFFRQLRSTLRRSGNSHDDAEDLIQDAFLRFEQHASKDAVHNPAAFIARTAFNLSNDARRRRLRSPVSATPLDKCDLVDLSPDAAEVLHSQERLKRLNDGISALSARSCRILLAQRVEGLTYPAIAKQEGISESAVEKHIARAVAFLADWMEGY